ncbi:hypothetical protein Hanom_Chr11g00986431 [Helianthus anomalus]
MELTSQMKMTRFQTFWIQMQKNKPLDESRKNGQTSWTKMIFSSKLIKKLTLTGSLLIVLASSSGGPAAFEEASLSEPGNRLISRGGGCDVPVWSLSLRSSYNMLFLAATKPDIADKSAPFDSTFFPTFDQAARWTNGPECEARLCRLLVWSSSIA